MTIIDIKKYVIDKVKYIFKKQGERFESDEELNKCILIHVVDNLPYERHGMYSQRKAQCEFCEQPHGQADTCDLRIGKLSANSDEGSKQITLKDIYETMRHKRDLVLGVIFKSDADAKTDKLEVEID